MSKRIATYQHWNLYPKGAVVVHKDTGDLGHVVGFARVYYDHGYETILKVLWDDEHVVPIHPSNVIIP